MSYRLNNSLSCDNLSSKWNTCNKPLFDKGGVWGGI